MEQTERDRIEGVMRDFLKKEGLLSNEHIIDHDWIRQEMAVRKAKEERDRRITGFLAGSFLVGLLTWLGTLALHWLRGGQAQP